jgi:hypothetical protein
MHKKVLMGLGVAALATALLAPSAQAAGRAKTGTGTQLAQAGATTGSEQPAKTKKHTKSKKKAHKSKAKKEHGSAAAPQQ